MTPLFERHRPRLDATLHALRCHTGLILPISDVEPFAASEAGQIQRLHLGESRTRACELRDEPPSPYGLALNVTYGCVGASVHRRAAIDAARAWQQTSLALRTGLALEACSRIHAASIQLAQALVHSTGEPPARALRRSVPVAQARALTAVAEAYEVMRGGQPSTADARLSPLVLDGPAREPLGVVLPEILAALVVGRAVLVRPHLRATLPLAIATATVRAVLCEQGMPVDLVRLCPEIADAGATLAPLTAPEPPPAPSGGNPVIIDGSDDLDGVAEQVADALLACSGQNATRPQNVFIPEDGIQTGRGARGFADVARAICGHVDGLLADPHHALSRRGAVQDPRTVDVAGASRRLATVIRDAGPAPLPGLPAARTLSPLVMTTTKEAVYAPAYAAPILFLIATADTAESIERAAHGAATAGATAAVVFSADDRVLEAAVDAFGSGSTAVLCNPGGGEHDAWPASGEEGLPVIDEAFVRRHLRRRS